MLLLAQTQGEDKLFLKQETIIYSYMKLRHRKTQITKDNVSFYSNRSQSLESNLVGQDE